MPTYSYTCCSCGHSLEAFQKITDAALKRCPVCKLEALQRGIGGGAATFRFEGSGFYINDYKKQPPAAEGCGCGKKTACCKKKES